MTKRKDGRWAKQIYIGNKDSGKIDNFGKPVMRKEYKTVYGKTKKEVEEKAFQLKIQLGKGINVSTSNDSFAKWAERFLSDKRTEGLSHSHIKNLENFCKHLYPIHHIAINKVEIQHVKGIIVDLAANKVDDNGEVIQKAFSKRTLLGIKQCASQIFNMAIEARAIDYNPASFVKIPKNAAKKTRNAIPEEQQRWIEVFSHKAQTAAMIMLHAGLRKGELTALTWADIDLKKSTIRVNKAVEYRTGQPTLKSTKTAAGERIIEISEVLRSYLAEEIAKHDHLDSIYVVHMQDGRMLSKIAWKRLWDSYMNDLNVEFGYTQTDKKLLGIDPDKKVSKYKPGGLDFRIERFTPHQLRHTFCTNCYYAEIDVQTCMAWMGHCDVKTTLGIYTHLDKQYKHKPKTKLDEYNANRQKRYTSSTSQNAKQLLEIIV